MNNMTVIDLGDLDGKPINYLLDIIDPIYEIDPLAQIEVRDNEYHDTLSGEVHTYQDIVIRHKDERGQ